MGNCCPSPSTASSPCFPSASHHGNDEGPSTADGNSQLPGSESPEEDAFPVGQILPTPNLKVFSISDLKIATRDFKSVCLVGRGRSWTVFKGWFDKQNLAPCKAGTGMVAVIKRLNPQIMQHRFLEWQAEVNFLGRLSHPNLVKLLGYCWDDTECLVHVYEFLDKGSLENHLFRRVSSLSWQLKLRTAVGAAKGLAFLHASNLKCFFKASDILLDGDYNAKISEFGMARSGRAELDSADTLGHFAPEYFSTGADGHLLPESAVYGYGVVRLEMLTGLRAMDGNRPPQQRNLVEWAKPSLSSGRKLK